MRFLFVLSMLLCLAFTSKETEKAESIKNPYILNTKKGNLRVLQYNIWNEGGRVEGGRKSIMQTIEEVNPDIVLFQEVRHQKFIDEVIEYFGERGINYYGQSLNRSSAFLSKYPIKSIRSSEELGKDSYAFVKATVEICNMEFTFYSVHLDWEYLAYYNVRGVDGQSYEKITPWNDVDEIIKENSKSRRPNEVKAIISDAKKEIDKGRIVIMGGDFNEPSFMDWGKETKDIRDHNGLVIPWECTTMLYEAGFIDCYRSIYPNSVTHPGFTCNAGNKWANPADLTLAEKDDRERIDLNFYYPDKRIKLLKASVVGPKEDFIDGKVVYEKSKDKIYTPHCVWASDHKAVWTEYKIYL